MSDLGQNKTGSAGEAGTNGSNDPNDKNAQGQGTGDGKGEKGPTFTQEQVNRMIGERLAKEKEDRDQALKELNALRTKSEMTAKERQEWEQKYNQLAEKNLTGEELKARELEKARKEKAEIEAKYASEVKLWKSNYEEALISNSVKDASEAHEAFSAKQIENNLRSYIRVVPIKDDKGNETGRFQTRVAFPSKSKEGQDIIMDLTVNETVALMKESKEYVNLFKGKGFGGVGSKGNEDIAQGTPEDYARRGPEAYRKAVAEGKIKFK